MKIQSYTFIFILFLSPLGQAAEKPSTSCELLLRVVNEKPEVSQTSSTETHRFLNFVRDMKNFGFEFSAVEPQTVKAEFQKASSENLKRMIQNYISWLVQEGRVLQQDQKEVSPMVLWKDIAQTSFNQRAVYQRLEDEMKVTKGHDKSMWLTMTQNIGGVLFQLHPQEKSEQDLLVEDSRRQGLVRVQLKETSSEWMYMLPLAGATRSGYGMDFRFLTFLKIFSPDLFQHFSSVIRNYLPRNLSDEDLLKGDHLFNLDQSNERAKGWGWLKDWRLFFHQLILTEEDAAKLLNFVLSQEPSRKGLSMLEPPFDAFQSLTMVIGGRVSSQDYEKSEIEEPLESSNFSQREFEPKLPRFGWPSQRNPFDHEQETWPNGPENRN